MADVKWIKLDIGIFDDEKIKILYSMPEGAELVIIWLRLLCLAGKCNQHGFLMLADNVPYNNEFLASLFQTDIKLVKLALDTFCSLGMIDVIDNRMFISNWYKYQNGDKLEDYQQKHRERQQRYRERLKALPDKEGGDVTCDVTSDVICSLSNISISNKKDKGCGGKRTPTLDEVKAYIKEKGYKVDAVQFFNYYEAGNWHDKDGKPVKNWKQRIISWNGRETKKADNKFHNFEERKESLEKYMMKFQEEASP